MADNVLNSKPGLSTSVERFLLKNSILGLAGRLTVNENGLTIGRQNSFGNAFDRRIDSFTGATGDVRGRIGKALMTTPFDFVTKNDDGSFTVGPKRNAFAQFKDSIVDFLK